MRFFILISSFCSLISCVGQFNYPVPTRLKNAMNCYDSTNTGLDSLMDIHGYYETMNIRDKSGLYKYVNGNMQEIGIDTTYHKIIFYKDGIYINDIGFRDSTVEQGLTQMALEGRTFSGRAYYQGTYQLSGDTIITQYISPGYGNVWFGYETWYKIIDNKTIQAFYGEHIGLLNTDKKNVSYQPKVFDNAPYSKFVFVEKMPKSDTWLKREPWFICK